MNTLRNTLAALCLAATTLAAHAIDLRVAISANFNLPPLSAGPGALTLDFQVADPIVGAFPQSADAFTLDNVVIAAVFNGSPATSVTNQVAWFAYGDQNYFGIDLRFGNLLVPGDLLQMIITTNDSLYTGTSAAPVLERLSLSGLGGGIYYYPTGSGAFTAEGPLSNVTYDVSAVPEPAAVWLLAPGLLLIGAVRRRRLGRR